MIKLILIVLGLLMIAFGVWYRPKPPLSVTLGMPHAEGVVTRFEDVPGLVGSFRGAIIELKTADNKPVTIKVRQPSNYRLGEKLTVYYDPDRPDRDWSIPSRSLPVSGYFSIGLGLLLAVIGLFLKAPA
jgi:hypothetical protein